MDSATPFAPVDTPDEQVRHQVATLISAHPDSLGTLGRLGEVGSWLASCQGVFPPRPIGSTRLVLFTGDPSPADAAAGAADPTPAVLTRQVNEGEGAIATLARASGVGVRLVEVSPSQDFRGDGHRDHMSLKELEHAFEIGTRVTDQEIDSGVDLLIPASSGSGDQVVAAALAGALTRTEPVAVIGPGYDLDTEEWKLRVTAVRDAMFRVRYEIDDPLTVLRRIASPHLAALVACCAQAAVRRTPVLIDDTVVATAGLIADRLAPGARGWFHAAQAGVTPAQERALADLGLSPMLDLGISLGSGAGALSALPLYRSAVELLADAAVTETP